MSTLSIDDRSNRAWCLDSGATHRMTLSPSTFVNTHPYHDKDSIIICDDTRLPISQVGTVSISTSQGCIILPIVLHVPDLCKNLPSISFLSMNLNS